MLRYLYTRSFLCSQEFIGYLSPIMLKGICILEMCNMKARDNEAGKANIELLVGWRTREQCCVGCRKLCEYIMLGAGRVEVIS